MSAQTSKLTLGKSGLSESNKHFWPRTIADFLVLQFRIGLTLVILIPLAINLSKDWDRLHPPGIVFILFACLAPIIALIFLINRKTLIWTTFLLVFTAIGASIGLTLGFAAGEPHDTERLLVLAAIPAGLFWWLAVRIKQHYTGTVKSTENGG